ncbi:MAG: beta-mannosidase [Paenibacillus sp.]|nr:beta-mannosidase [Paenibacillus sp.]
MSKAIHKRKLNQDWMLQGFDTVQDIPPAIHQPDFEAKEWLSANVPGDVHAALLHHQIIEDPFYSTNDQACRWVENKTWVYRTVFDRPADVGNAGMFIHFEGLDTLAEIYLNGESVATSDNMFVPVWSEITSLLKASGNVLIVRLDPVVEAAKSKDVSKFWAKVNYERIWFRKCASHFSWDWSPRLVTSGIWKPVSLYVVEQARINHVYFRTLSIGEDGASVEIDAEVEQYRGKAGLESGVDDSLTVRFSLKGSTSIHEYETVVSEGRAAVSFKVEQPELWWTYDHGLPFLYELEVSLLTQGLVIDSDKQDVGIRTIQVKQRSDANEPRFTFVLNGREIYAKGANWIPAHCLTGSIESDRYCDLIALSREANMNMLRVWGGGIYEHDIFYRECSRQGILVWQDFMFSCSELPDYDEEFMANVTREIVANVKALRSHPCIAIWCGNNESQAIHSEKMYYRSDYRFYGEKIFHELIPKLLERLDTTRLYWPSSPWGGNDPNSFDEGDTHNWAVWAGDVYPRRYGEKSNMDITPYGVSYRRYAEDTSKFSSEFGIHGSTIKETLRRNMPETELYYGSFEMDYRNKDYEPEKAQMTMGGYSGLPGDLDQYIDFSMLCQAEGLKFGVEHFRRRKPVNSGALIWQLNDCWPGISWSLLDYYLFPKAAYYYARRFYNPLLLSFKEDEGRISVWMTNDTYEHFEDTITVGVMDDNHYFFAEHKDSRFSPCKLTVAISQAGDKLELHIGTDRFARFIKLECAIEHTLFSDNYFNLLPGECHKVVVSNRKGTAVSPSDIEVRALNSNQDQTIIT